MEKQLSPEEIKELFNDAIPVVHKFNTLIPHGARTRDLVFDDLKTGICAMRVSKEQKAVKFDVARLLVSDAMETVSDENREEAESIADELYKMIDVGKALTCGGP